MVSWNLLDDPKHRGSILRNMANSEGDQLLAGAFHAIMDKIEADILQIAKKWNWKWIFIHQGYFFRKDSGYKCQFYIKIGAPSGRSLKFGQNIETWCKNKDLCLNSTDKQLKRSEISAEEISFQIMSFCFQFWMLLLLTLKSISENVTS